MGAEWAEIDIEARLWVCPPERMKGKVEHRVPLTEAMIALIEPLRAMKSKYVFEGQKRHQPLSNMAMLMLLRRMGIEGVTVHGFRSTFRVWASEVAEAPREVAEMSLAHKVGNDVERAVLSQSFPNIVSSDIGRDLGCQVFKLLERGYVV